MEIRKTNYSLEIDGILIPYKTRYIFIKRTIDIVGVLVGLLFFLPLFILIAVLIKIEDPNGTIFFTQERVGKNQQNFSMYKFRTMYPDAEKKLQELLAFNEIEGTMFKMKDDPRVTRVGKYLRIFSLDELPQLFNVLLGNMTLVGPRPPLPREVEEYTNYDKQRLIVKPGITGLWQVSGRNALSFQQMVELDLKYIKAVSTLNDLKIIFKTVIVVLTGKDAY